MHIAKGIEKKCSTCDHWAGLRALEEGGFIYSLENVEGICKGAEPVEEGAEPVRTLTLPADCCASWERWSELASHIPAAQGNNARHAAAYSA